MRWPWEARAERLEEEAAEAKVAYEQVEDQWEEVRSLADSAREQRELNGWTGRVLEIFGG